MALVQERPREVPKASEQVRLIHLTRMQEYLAYLQEGPDSYETIDSVSISTDELNFDYEPLVIWSLTLVNDGSSSPADIEIRFTDTFGRTRKFRLKTTDSEFKADWKGSLGGSFRAQARSGTQVLRGVIALKRPFEPTPLSGGPVIPSVKVEMDSLPLYLG